MILRVNKIAIKGSLLIMFLVMISGCGIRQFQESYTLTIGHLGENRIVEVTDTFTLEEQVSFELDGNKEIGSPIKILVIKHDGDVENIYYSYDEEIDPTWAWVQYTITPFEEAGNYTIKVFNSENKLLGKGDFTVN